MDSTPPLESKTPHEFYLDTGVGFGGSRNRGARLHKTVASLKNSALALHLRLRTQECFADNPDFAVMADSSCIHAISVAISLAPAS